jgi:hypothetical protein
VVDPRVVFAEIVEFDPVGADVSGARAQLGRVGKIRSFLESVEIVMRRILAEEAQRGKGVDPDREVEQRGGRTRNEAGKVKDRSSTWDEFPQMEEELSEGAITGAHLDALHRELARLDEAARERFVEVEGERLARVAAQMSADDFGRHVRDCVRLALVDAGLRNLAAQKRAVRLRSWTDIATGMGKFVAELDPESALRFQNRLRARVEQLFHDREPEGCPADPVHKQQYLQALAFISLLDDEGGFGTVGPPDLIVVVDEVTLRTGLVREGSIVDVGGEELWLPIETIRRMACTANIIPAVLNSDGVLVDLGRAVRLATTAQRRALRAMYPTRRVPGCRVPFERCHVHHIRYWQDGGRSDLDSMVPLCNTHHHCVHEGGWQLTIDPRTFVLTITRPDGSIETTGPPHARAG